VSNDKINDDEDGVNESDLLYVNAATHITHRKTFYYKKSDYSIYFCFFK